MAALRPVFCVIAFLLCASLQSQIYFARTFGGVLEDGGYGLAATPSGLYVAAGYTSSFGAGASDGFLLAVNGLGFWQWQKTYGGPDADVLRDIVWQGQYGYVVGYSKSFPDGKYRGWLLCINELGDTLYARSYEAPGWMLLHGITADAEGLYLAGLMHDSLGIARGCVLRCDSAGQLVWAFYQQTTGFEESEYKDISVFGDSLLALAGRVVVPGGDQQALITFIRKSNGQLVRNEVVGLTSYAEEATGISVEGSRAWFCGSVDDVLNTRRCPLLGYVDLFAAGHFMEAYFFQLQYNNVFNKLKIRGFYDFIVSGNSEFIGLGFKAAILFSYRNGMLEWGTNVGTEGWNNAESVVLATDGTVWATGELTGIGPGPRALLFWKLDSTGYFVLPANVSLAGETPDKSFLKTTPEGLWVAAKWSESAPLQVEVLDMAGRVVYRAFKSPEEPLLIPACVLPRAGLVRLTGRHSVQCFRFLWYHR